jgi:hypothetical protein
VGSRVSASCYKYLPLQPNSIFFRAEFGGALLAPELTGEKDRKKMTGSLVFYEAESIEEVRKLVESDIYYTSGVVRLWFPWVHSPIDLTLLLSGTRKTSPSYLLCLQCAGRRIRPYKRFVWPKLQHDSHHRLFNFRSWSHHFSQP